MTLLMTSEVGARAAFACTLVLVLLAGCGPSQPPIAAKPDVVVTIDGEHHACLVALKSEAQASSVSCDDVVSFVKDELRLPSGSIYDLRAKGDVGKAEMAKVEAILDGAGFRFIGGPHGT
ncbi:MAG TPA: hypothetical protein VKG63_12405 [Steroidobacteraceae bacterium]|nr:hypothetical protein [Steroidobacteraceae bacterium]